MKIETEWNETFTNVVVAVIIVVVVGASAMSACGPDKGEDPAVAPVYCDNCLFECRRITCEYHTVVRLAEDGQSFVECGWPCENGRQYTLAFSRDLEADTCYEPIAFRVYPAPWCE